MKTIITILCIALIVSASGCATSPALDIVDPFLLKKPDYKDQSWWETLAVELNRENDRASRAYVCAGGELLNSSYSAAVDATEQQRCKARFAYLIFQLVNEYHEGYKVHLRGGRALVGTVFDYLILGLTAAGTVVSGEAIKSALAAAATGVEGANLSYNLNWFNDLTTEIILQTMNNLRDTKRAEIIHKLSGNEANTYVLEALEDDLLLYFYAGSLPNALTSLQQEAQEAGQEAQDILIRAKGLEALYEPDDDG